MMEGMKDRTPEEIEEQREARRARRRDRRFNLFIRLVAIAGLYVTWWLGDIEAFYNACALLGAMAWIFPPSWT